MNKFLKILFVVILLFSLTAFAVGCSLFGEQKAAVGISSIEKTGTKGLVDTYTITLTNGETSTFTVTNGKDGASANGNSAESNVTSNDYFRFNLLEDDTYEVSARYADMPSRVVIPATYNGKKVTKIAKGAFFYNLSSDDYPHSSIDEIVLPDTITTIGRDAFSCLYYLKKINIPNSVTQIGARAFYNCNELSSTEYNGAYYFGNERNPYMFLQKIADAEISELTIPEGTVFVNDYVFSNCKNLTSVTIPSTVKNLGYSNYSYSRYGSISTIHYQGSLIDWCNISQLYGLMGQTSDDLSLYINGTKLEGELVISGEVSAIAESAFTHCTGITKVIISEGVQEISGAFQGCASLTSITLPKSISYIGSSAFYGCTALSEITYEGTMADWISNVFYSPNNLTIHCTDGDIEH